MSHSSEFTAPQRERVLVCGAILPGQLVEHEGPLSEARGLCHASDVEVIGEGIVQRRVRPDSATLLGKGKVEEVKAEVEFHHPDAVVVDNDLTPAQGRNLEKAWGVRVVDRSELILDIFARRAQTRQARLQVELAQTEYMLPRLRRLWTHLERMEGAVGARGPGETQLETDRRLIRKRITDLRRDLKEIERRKQRQVQTRSEQFTIGLVGYTNAGKSTLLNTITGADVLAADMLFATLDTRTRKWELEDGRTVLVSDTVGFLRRLPHHLVASFHATLEEALEVDLLLHVVDASHPDAQEQMAAVDSVLTDLAVRRRADLLVLNKVDQLEDPIRLQLLARDRAERIVHISAHTGEGIDRLVRVVTDELDARSARMRLTFGPADGRTASAVRDLGGVESQRWLDDGSLELVVRLTEGALGNLRRTAEPGVRFEMLEEPELRRGPVDPVGPVDVGDPENAGGRADPADSVDTGVFGS